jgi:hypothetical protein
LENVKYIASLHRPFSQQLKTTRWVCEYIANTSNVTSSTLNLGFYYYLVTRLNKEYSKEIPEEFNGLPSDVAIFTIYEYIKNLGKKKFISLVPSIIRSRNTQLEKQIYSTYKAASYYVNLAKDKFSLIDEKNQLTGEGKQLLNFKSNFFKLSTSEKLFYFDRIMEADFHLFITHCLFDKLEKRYSLKISAEDELIFISKYLKIGHFNFTTSSLENYNIVREHWIMALNVIDVNGKIRKRYSEVIETHPYYKKAFEDLTDLFSLFEYEHFKSKKKYLVRKRQFLEAYKNVLKSNVSDLGFVNLHDIKQAMKVSTENFQKFINDFYELEKNNMNIFFSNTVNSIDRRKRFIVRNRPVIKIKIK